ncbi:dipeptidylaminopeptidase/acylaminoacyl-peptidase [Haloferax mucosum ATCC BAA-1512]|uniref:Dipeptidylaminopeptidase/acylaminoacyl-peptidase n=1 Tax=Haloferax mucosum ATCC BAA-1512 TaxID=662479 RepID=M0IGK4_9EURY|nr:prolyl oligopeptidase family serine peptidase [Haloferax mucosum]ELZ94973.1 dipeptidylaminopeptidase/acylaminoacyl-peptidase [Haloferax mucosum ATCC BAA-1512]
MSTSDDTNVLERLASLPTVRHPTVSPDGDEIALYYDGTGRNELHILDAETGDLDQWSDGEVPRDARWPIAWDADGDRVFFHLDEAGDEQNDIYAFDRGGTVDPVVELPGQNSLYDVGDDGETLLVGSTRDGQMNLYRHDLPTGETTKLTDYDRAVLFAHLSPDCERVVYGANEAADTANLDVYIADIDGSNPRRLDLGKTGAETAATDWGPEGERLLLSDDSPGLNRCGVYDLAADEVTWFGDGDYEEVPVSFVDGGRTILATRPSHAATVPVVYDVRSGDVSVFDLPDGVSGFGMRSERRLNDDRVLVSHTTPTRRTELVAYDVSTDERETLLEADHGDFSTDDFADAEYIRFESDGVPETPAKAVSHDPYDELEIGALFYDSGRRPSPLVVNPHGGPRARDSKSFSLYTQFLIQCGFSVLQVNYRGSTGRGREFVEELFDDWGGAEQGDVATAVEHVLDTYNWLDEDRVVVFGGSYGGYSAYWQSVQYPDLYAASIAWIGVSDLHDMYDNTMPHFQTRLMELYLGDPEENADLYTERSPTTHAENVDAPLCILHGVNDRRVPISQARLFRDALDEHGYEEGTDYEYHELGDEGHASSDIDQKTRTFELLADFLDRRVEPTTVTADD